MSIKIGSHFSRRMRCLLFSTAFLAYVVLGGPASAATIRIEYFPSGGSAIFIKGAIVPGDERRFADIVKSLQKSREIPTVNLDSEGGDLDTALRLGQLVRRAEMNTTTDSKCFSACVFVLAGGIQRNAYLIPEPGLGVGIHRFHFSDLSPSATKAEVAAKYSHGKQSINAYLSEMNISLELVEAMESVPPDRLRMLNDAELAHFRLVGMDPVHEELAVAKIASLYGISSSEWRRRDALRIARCGLNPLRGNLGSYSSCTDPIMWNLPTAEYERRQILFRQVSAQLNKAQRIRCARVIFNEAKKSCN